ncbi:MAG TPA: alpha/beta hydrolase [Candidatus Limnocylindria bacterium]|nr:alpha/beta hydrolase [Candidatus Limnocylindria bacterium]
METEGDGPPVILQTGAGGDMQMWRLAGYVSALRNFRAVLLDHRGHGRSDRPRERQAHRLSAYVDDVIAVADALDLQTFSYLGYSDGAVVGYELAAQYGRRIRAVAGIGAVETADGWHERRVKLAAEVRIGGTARLVEALGLEEGGPVNWFADQMRSTDPEMFALELECWISGPWSAFPQIDPPALIVVGELEEGVGHAAEGHAREAVRLMLRGRYAVLPALNHITAFARSESALSHLLPFLRENG